MKRDCIYTKGIRSSKNIESLLVQTPKATRYKKVMKKHQKAGQNQEAGIVAMEAALHISNVMVVYPTDDKPTRVGYASDKGEKCRISKRTGKPLD